MGYELNSGENGCDACAADHYKAATGNEVCTACPAGSTTDGATGATECMCSAGYYSSDGLSPCTMCDSRSYQDSVGSSSCILCVFPHSGSYLDADGDECVGSSVSSGRDSAGDCSIKPGWVGSMEAGWGNCNVCWSTSYKATYSTSDNCITATNSQFSPGVAMTADSTVDTTLSFTTAESLSFSTTEREFHNMVGLQAPWGKRLQLSFSDFDVDESAVCETDTVTIYDGQNYANAAVLGTFCGNVASGTMHDLGGVVYSTSSIFISSGQHIMVVVKGDGDEAIPSFTIDYQAICAVGEYLDTDTDTCVTCLSGQPFGTTTPVKCYTAATSSPISHTSSSSEDTGWIIEASDSNMIIRLVFTSLSVEEDSTCSTDSLTLYTGDDQSVTVVKIYTLCGSDGDGSIHDDTNTAHALGDTYESSAYIMSVAWVTDGSSNSFSFTYEEICAKGYEPDGADCDICAENFYNDVPGDSCQACPSDSTTAGIDGAINVGQCLCDAGFYMDSSTTTCEPCPPDTFSILSGAIDGCDVCPALLGTDGASGATSNGDCTCKPGNFLDSGTCTVCPTDTYSTEVDASLCANGLWIPAGLEMNIPHNFVGLTDARTDFGVRMTHGETYDLDTIADTRDVFQVITYESTESENLVFTISFTAFDMEESAGCSDDKLSFYDMSASDGDSVPELVLCGGATSSLIQDSTGNVYSTSSTFTMSTHKFTLVYFTDGDASTGTGASMTVEAGCASGMWLSNTCEVCATDNGGKADVWMWGRVNV